MAPQAVRHLMSRVFPPYCSPSSFLRSYQCDARPLLVFLSSFIPPAALPPTDKKRILNPGQVFSSRTKLLACRCSGSMLPSHATYSYDIVPSAVSARPTPPSPPSFPPKVIRITPSPSGSLEVNFSCPSALRIHPLSAGCYPLQPLT